MAEHIRILRGGALAHVRSVISGLQYHEYEASANNSLDTEIGLEREQLGEERTGNEGGAKTRHVSNRNCEECGSFSVSDMWQMNQYARNRNETHLSPRPHSEETTPT
jgi:hypothetical protein